MTAKRLRSMSSVLLATVGASVVGATSALGVQTLAAEVALLAGEGWIMNGTGASDPTQGYLNAVEGLYLSQFAGYTFNGLNTPEEFCPFVCFPAPADDPSSWSSMNFGQSLATGVAQLDGVLQPALTADPDANLAVLGYSQSATIATLEMQNLVANHVSDPNLHFVLLGDPNNPIGGILDRFDFPSGVGPNFSSIGQHIPFVNIPVGIGATPTDAFPTDIYTGEYDGWGNFPQDPSNILADINALVGIATVHPYYPDPTPGTNLDTNDIINLGTIGLTSFHMIPAPLPLLAWMYDGGPAGQFFYDFFAPSMALSINWAYGNPGDPAVGVNGTDAIGPWAVNASGDLVPSGGAGFIESMDPLQMLAGMQYAGVQSFVGPINDLLQDAGQAPLSQSVVDAMLSGYDFTNQLDQLMLKAIDQFGALFGTSDLADTLFSGAPLISAQPLIDLAGWGFDAFNLFGA